MVTNNTDTRFLKDLYVRCHQLAQEINEREDIVSVYEKFGANPESLLEFKSGIFKGNVDIDVFSMFSDFSSIKNNEVVHGSKSPLYKFYLLAIDMVKEFLGNGFTNMLTDFSSVAITWIIIFVIVDKRIKDGTVKEEELLILRLVSLLLGFHIGFLIAAKINSPVLYDLQAYVLDKVRIGTKEEEVPVAEAANDDGVVSIIVITIAAIIGATPRSGLEKPVVSFLKNVNQCKGGVSIIFGLVSKMFKDFLVLVNAPESFLTFFSCNNVHESVILFHERVTDFCVVCKNQEISFNDISLHYHALRADYVTVSKFVTKEDRDSHAYLSEARKRLETEYFGVRCRHDSLKGSRIEPVGIMLSGRPATMKSALSNHLANAINSVTLPDSVMGHFSDNPDMFKYSKGPDKFWDGYSPIANVTIFDDVFQARAVPGGSREDSEAFNVIKTINTAEYALPIAVAENKGTSFFRSPYCIYTSNMENVNAQEDIHCKDALRRRFHFWIEVAINSRYSDWIKDRDTVITLFPKDFWVLKVTETVGAEIVERECNDVEQLLSFIVAKARVHKERYETSFSSVSGLDVDYMKLRDLYNPTPIESDLDMEDLPVSQGIVSEVKRKWRERLFNPSKHGPFVIDEKLKVDDNFVPGYFKASSPFLPYIRELDDDQKWNKVIDQVQAATGYDLSRDEIIVIIEKLALEDKHVRQVAMLKMERYTARSIVTMMVISAVEAREAKGLDVRTGSSYPLLRNVCVDKLLTKVCSVSSILAVLLALKIAGTTVRLFLRMALSFFYGYDADAESGNVDRYVAPGKTKIMGPPRVKVLRKPDSSSQPQGLWEDSYRKNGFNGLGLTRNASSDIVEKIMKKNFFILYYVDENDSTPEKKRIGHCVNISSDFYMMPYHFINILHDFYEKPGIDDKKEVHFTVADNSRRFKMKLADFLMGVKHDETFNKKDLCLVQTHQEITAKGALSYFISDMSPVRKRKKFDISFYTVKQNGDHVTAVLTKSSASFKNEVNIRALWIKDRSDMVYTVPDVLEYPMKTIYGDCGSIIVIDDPTVGHEIVVGMHIAGHKGTGYCNIISQEDFAHFKRTYGTLAFTSEEELPISVELDRPVAESGVFPDAETLPPFKTPHNRKTEIIKSKIYGKVPIEGRVRTAPAYLSDFVKNGEVISPLGKALSKYNPEPVAINLYKLYQAEKSYYVKFQSGTRIDRGVIPLREALHHFGDHMNTVDSSSSGGWPLNTIACDDIKKNYYRSVQTGNIEMIDFCYNEIDTLVSKAVKMYDNHERPAFLYVDNLKDEIRPLEKVKEGKTRMFSGSPFIMLVLFRMYFGSFMDEFVHANLDIGSAIGINPYGEDWHVLAKKLLKHSDGDASSECIGAGDFSAFDCSQQVEVLNVIYHLIATWYGGSDSHASYIRSMLWAEITSSRHVHDGKVYYWYSSLPSGNPLTAMVNTMYNQIAFRYCWIQAGLDIHDFNSNVELNALGDDNIFSVSSWYREAFNELTLVKYMKTIGLTYTTETKGTAVKAMRRLTDVGFLKRKFRYEEKLARWVGPIEKSTIANLLDWTKDKDGDTITVDKAVSALRELSLHGKEEYDKICNLIISAVQENVTLEPPQSGWPLRWIDVLEDTSGIDHTLC